MRVTGRSSDSAYYWLATRFDGVRMEALTVDGVGGSLLPVFGSREGARGFILSAWGIERWRARPTGTGELVSMLVRAGPEVKRVVMDPLPETLEDRRDEPVGESREGFIDSLLERNRVWSGGNPGRKKGWHSGMRAETGTAYLAGSRS